MRKILFVAMASLCIVCKAAAQDVETPKYQRSSLHMVLLTTDEPTLEGADDFTAQLDKSWQNYPFPDKYNQHRIDYTQGYGGTPKGSLMELINTYKGGFEGMSLTEAQALMEKLTAAKEYNDCLVDTIQNIINTEKIGNQLIRKWFNIQDDGSWDYDLITERAEYNANQAAVAEANATTRGVQAIIDQGENLISNTFVTFSKLSFYPSGPVAAFTRDLATLIGSYLPGPAGLAATAAATAAYQATNKGYTAKTTTALYKLDWNDEIKATFYSMFTPEGKIDMGMFNDYTFTMSLVGIDNATSTTIDALGGLGEIVGVESAKPDDQLIEQTIIRNIDKILAKMQKTYEVFAPVSQIISVDPLVADMGMKEGLEGGESFNLLEPRYNPETNQTEWKSIGVVKVNKKQIWENRYSLTDEAKKAAESDIQGTVLSPHKKAAVGMVVKQVVTKGKDKKKK